MKRVTLAISFALTGAVSAVAWEAKNEVADRSTERRPEFNFYEAKVPHYELLHPLQTSEGGMISSTEGWPAQRRRVLELFRENVYGRSPGKPDRLSFEILESDASAMSGQATLRRISVKSRVGSRQHQFELILFVPKAAVGPVPVFLLLNNRGRELTDPNRAERSDFWPAERAIQRGFAIAALQVGELAPDDRERFRDGVIRLFEGESESRAPDAWGALAAWGWGASRAMDYFETDGDIDASRVAVIGHSRGGKAALWAGAEDTRFALVISNESGCGGAALSRRRFGETVARINTNFPHWFCDNFNRYNGREWALPIDQHLVVGLIAPRAVYIGSADQDLWADPRGEFLSLAHASPVYALWGYPRIEPGAMPPLDQPLRSGPRAYHVRSGAHDLTLFDWERYMDFADAVFQKESK